MIVYKIDVLHELKQKGYSTYSLRKNKIMGEAQIQKIRQGELASKETLNTICRLLQIQPGDLLEYIDDDTNVSTIQNNSKLRELNDKRKNINNNMN